MTDFNSSEEAFLLSTLKEVTKIWAKGKGQANFHLDISDGCADLQLKFKLGNPCDLHCDVDPPQPHPVHEQPRHRRWKGPGRRERDRLRAQEHQTKQEPVKAAVPAVKLPFTGRILPVKEDTSKPKRKPEESSQTAASAVSPTTVAAVVTPEANAKFPGNIPGIVIRNPKLSPQRYIDVGLARKQLFVQAQTSSPSGKLPRKKSYQMKENDLWTKLFKT